jgi:hypothetical protein
MDNQHTASSLLTHHDVKYSDPKRQFFYASLCKQANDITVQGFYRTKTGNILITYHCSNGSNDLMHMP